MRHVIKTIVAEMIKPIYAKEIIFFLKVADCVAEKRYDALIVIFPGNLRERENHSDGLCAVLQAKFNIIFQTLKISKVRLHVIPENFNFFPRLSKGKSSQIFFPVNSFFGGNIMFFPSSCKIVLYAVAV